MRPGRPLTRTLALALLAAQCTGCAISVHVGSGSSQAEAAYTAVMSRPSSALTAAAADATATCAGGSRPDVAACLANTKTEIKDARALEQAMRSVPVPASYAKANTDLTHGLNVFIQGLTERNDGLAARSTGEYSAGQAMVNKSLTMQKAAIAEYPASANIKL